MADTVTRDLALRVETLQDANKRLRLALDILNVATGEGVPDEFLRGARRLAAETLGETKPDDLKEWFFSFAGEYKYMAGEIPPPTEE